MLPTVQQSSLLCVVKIASIASSSRILPLAFTAFRRHNYTTVSRNIFEATDEEEAEEKKRLNKKQPRDDKPWDGEEPVKHSVLRMLIDKYPRTLKVEGAARRNLPQPQSNYVPPTQQVYEPQKREEEKSAQLKKVEREQKLRESRQARLSNARESAFDYAMSRKYPVDEERNTLKDNITKSNTKKDVDWDDWDLEDKPRSIEELGVLSDARIRAARAKGEFDNLPGRGKPLKEDPMINNPFVDRTEYFLNRIIQRNGAAPPWVIMQQEVDTEVSSLRSQLNSALKRCLNEIKDASGNSGNAISKKSLVKQFDTLEKSYFTKELERVNSRVRSYNVMCPEPVRKPLIEFQKELEAAFHKNGFT